ncbi:MAG TPA: hypothetical protein VEB21_00875 [Terriglobales bacterium]|nr:hypothetical protein [Terriglobales bacterium]
MFAKTSGRVRANSSRVANESIDSQVGHSVQWHAAHPGAIPRRLAELEQEWDIERVLEANAASVSLIGLALGTYVNRKFFALPALVAGFLMQHALQGWCPPVGLFRRLGVRTQGEIDEERYALKALRGDFSALPQTESPHMEDQQGFVYAVRH